ncbi:MAG: hypothetical protein ACRC5G_08045, partial [Cetobacterium sp.]
MANTNINIFKNTTGGAGLPIPKVKLLTEGNTVQIEFDRGTSLFTLKKAPIVTVQDLTQEQIDKGVYLEMLYYKRSGRSVKRDINGARF